MRKYFNISIIVSILMLPLLGVLYFNIPQNQEVEISSNTPEVGKVVEEMKGISVEGEELKNKFFLFGMGLRDKIIYKEGCIYNYKNKKPIECFNYRTEKIIPWEYKVILEDNKKIVEIYENEEGIFIKENGKSELLVKGTRLNLPNFNEYGEKNRLLRVLHHEVLINITNDGPVPNIFVYSEPWFRDAAVMTMVLEKTNNLHLIENWASNLDYIYDENNKVKEPDNLGEVLYILGALDEKEHPLVRKILNEADNLEKKYGFISGTTDGAILSYYQTLWFDLGLKKIGINRDVKWPLKKDEYSDTFWYGNRHSKQSQQISSKYNEPWPYLTWARANYYKADPPYELSYNAYPITHEIGASQAKIENMRWISEEMYDKQINAPHGWAAAEMFLYFYNLKEN